MIQSPSDIRAHLLEGVVAFVESAVNLPGLRKIELIGSIVTDKPNPKDVDLLVTIEDDADLARLAVHARRLQGRMQQLNCGADIFLADVQGHYLGRTCHWRDCRPGVRASCDALHCGRRPHLHDDLATIRLSDPVIASAPVQLWPVIERRRTVPADVEQMLVMLENGLAGSSNHPSNQTE